MFPKSSPAQARFVKLIYVAYVCVAQEEETICPDHRCSFRRQNYTKNKHHICRQQESNMKRKKKFCYLNSKMQNVKRSCGLKKGWQLFEDLFQFCWCCSKYNFQNLVIFISFPNSQFLILFRFFELLVQFFKLQLIFVIFFNFLFMISMQILCFCSNFSFSFSYFQKIDRFIRFIWV